MSTDAPYKPWPKFSLSSEATNQLEIVAKAATALENEVLSPKLSGLLKDVQIEIARLTMPRAEEPAK